ncbi:MAG: glycoside hydrolase family 31 protein [Clostridia bacterium]|nr:glycoside hydrolase family 31 protein [Clostridia bacterium]
MAAIELKNGFSLKIDVLTETCFRLRMSMDKDFRETNPYARYGIFDFSGNGASVGTSSVDGVEMIATSGMSIAINRGMSLLSVMDPEGKELIKSAAPLWAGREGGFSLELAVGGDEKFYGLGDVNRETLERRGSVEQIWVRNVKSYVPIPFLMSSAGWALFCNTTFRHNFDICATDPNVLKVFGYYGEMDFLFFTGSGYASLLDQYTAVSGRPSLLPKFGYGLTFVCNMQANAKEMFDDCMNFRNREIPCDVVGLEPKWMETYYDKSVNKKFDEERFYIPPWCSDTREGLENTFFGAIRRLGFKLSLWLCCDYDLGFEEERNALIPPPGFIHEEKTDCLPSKDDFEQDMNIGHEPLKMDEFTVKDQGFFEHLKKFVDMGASAFKMDGAWQVNEHPDRKWGNGMDDVQMHNLYPLLLSKQMSTGFSKHTGRRSMIYSSGGFAGIQKYAATWAGDTGGGPKPLLSMLNHAMSGHVNTSCDMLVFTKEGIHFGFLQSWSQLCSWAYWRHPWLLGTELEGIFKDYARLRYSLIPYIYSTAYQAYLKGMPVMRPLPFVFPKDGHADDIKTEYMLGDNFLVSCFTDDLYLPEGKWIDYFTGREFTGPYSGKYEFPKGKGGGLFVRSGAIIPSQPVMNYVGERPVDELTLDIFPDGESSFTIYDDDGITLDYRDGRWVEIPVSCIADSRGIRVMVSAASYKNGFRAPSPAMNIRIHAPESPDVRLDMEACAHKYENGCICVHLPDYREAHAIAIFY